MHLSDRVIHDGPLAPLWSKGYFVDSSVFDHSDVEGLRQDILSLARPKADAHPGDLYLENALSSSVVREFVQYPAVESIGKAICGPDATIRSVKGWVRAVGSPRLGLHTDTGIWMAAPFICAGQVVTVTVTCDEFSDEAGCTMVAPGSHLTLREPTAEESESDAGLVSLVAPPGSIVSWLGETWHGRRARLRDGVRVTLTVMFARPDVPRTAVKPFARDAYKARLTPP